MGAIGQAGWAAITLVIGVPATAQHPTVSPAPQPATADTKRIFTPADFVRFAPKTALDMLAQVPGFTIRQADGERGLGQASENVLINGQRIANKSGGAVDQLGKTPAATVARIEIADAATLGIAGLTGPVANVVLTASGKGSGNFDWRPNVRAHYARPNLLNGSASYGAKSGPVDYTLSVENDAGRGAYGGPVAITGPLGEPIERRREVYHGESDRLTFKTRFGLDGPGSSVGNLTLAVTPYWQPYEITERRVRTDGDDRDRVTSGALTGAYYDINADAAAALGPGRLKLIGVRHYEHQPRVTTQITNFDSGVAAAGVRFARDSYAGETVARAEYGWSGKKNGWQLALERAFNTLDQRGGLAVLSPAGQFEPTPFPGGSGQVEEVRYEGTATLSHPLGRALDFQLVAGAEQSALRRVDGDVPARHFFRPKGSASLAWRPASGWDTSLKVSRQVGQISFYDFLSQPNLQQERQNTGNPDLVPPQSWEAEAQVGREMGGWGKTRLTAHVKRVEDIIDYVPVGPDGEGIGNLPSASVVGAESVSTIQFDPLGWRGAKLDATLGFERTRVRDPLTGLSRPISDTRDYWLSLELRRDVPRTQLAWGLNADYGHVTPSVYLTEVSRSYEGPVFAGGYLEHKDVAGLTVRIAIQNVLNARHRLDRAVYDGRRTMSLLLFRQEANQLIGPILRLSIRGTF